MWTLKNGLNLIVKMIYLSLNITTLKPVMNGMLNTPVINALENIEQLSQILMERYTIIVANVIG